MPRKLSFRLGAGLGIALAASVTVPGLAQEASEPLRLELNRLEPRNESCRAYLLIDNRKGAAFKSLKVDLFTLDTQGIARRRIAVELGPVPAKKTLIKLFDFPELNCSQLGSVLLNGMLSCESNAGPIEGCLDRIETASKVSAISFTK